MAQVTVPIVCPGHTRAVVQLNYSTVTDDGVFLISACHDGKPMLRRGDTGDWIGTFEGHKGAVWAAQINASATRVVTGAADFSAKLWDALTGAELHTFTHPHIVKATAFSSEDRHILTGCTDKKIRLYDVERSDADPIVFEGHTGPIRGAVFTNTESNHFIVSGSSGPDNELRIWDPRISSSPVRSVELCGSMISMELSRDGRILTLLAGNVVYFFDTNTFDLLHRYELLHGMEAVSLHPNHPRFVVGGEDVVVHVFDFNTGQEVESYRGHHGPVHALRYSPLGDTFSSGSGDSTIRIWQTAPMAPMARGDDESTVDASLDV